MEKWSSQRIRELMTHIALRGMAANEVGCARISMMVRSMSSNTRPDTLVQDRTLQPSFSLATHGGSIHGGSLASHRCACDPCGMSAMHPLATRSARGNVPSRCAKTRLMHCSKRARVDHCLTCAISPFCALINCRQKSVNTRTLAVRWWREGKMAWSGKSSSGQSGNSSISCPL